MTYAHVQEHDGFKVGDKVMFTSSAPSQYINDREGEVGTIAWIVLGEKQWWPFAVAFDDEPDEWMCSASEIVLA